MKIVLVRVHLRCLTKSFMKWRYEWRQSKKLRRFVQTWLMHSAARAMQGWINYVDENIYIRKTMNKVLNKLKRKKLQQGYRSWLNYTRRIVDATVMEGIQHRRILLVVQRMRYMKKSNAFNAWCAMVETKSRLRFISKRLMNRQLAGAVTGWKSFVNEKIKSRQLMVKVMNNLNKTRLNSGFRSWLQFDRLVSDRNLTEGIRDRRMLHVLQRMKSLRVSSAFNSWCDMVQTNRKSRRIAGRIMFKLLASSFDGWCSFVTIHQNVRKVMVRSLNKMTKVLLQKGMRAWIQSYKNERNMEAVLLVREKKHLLKSFRRWHYNVQHLIQCKRKGRRAILHLFKRKSCKAFAKWKDTVRQSKHQRSVTKRILYKMIHVSTERKNYGFQRLVQNKLYYQKLEQRHMHLYNVVRTRMLHATTLKSFSTWKTTTLDNLRLKRVGRRAMAVLSRRFLLSSLYQWKKNVEAKMCAKNIGKYFKAKRACIAYMEAL